MKRQRRNPRLAKTHRTYSAEEIANLYQVHKNTVWRWIKEGLRTIDSTRPMLIHGRDLAEFIKTKREKNKRPLKPGEIYCIRCRSQKLPAHNRVDYRPVTPTQGNLIGICPTCGIQIYRRVNLSKLARIRGHLEIALPKALLHINESTHPSVNSDLR